MSREHVSLDRAIEQARTIKRLTARMNQLASALERVRTVSKQGSRKSCELCHRIADHALRRRS